MKLSVLAALFSLGAASGAFAQPSTAAAPHGPAGVSESQRHLVDRAGRPFFWLGDTAWMLFQKASREDVELYLSTRARQGFTVVQAAFVMGDERVGGTLVANAYGDQAFVAGNPARPSITSGSDATSADEYDYWDHVDFIVARAAAHRLTVAALPLFIGYRGEAYRYLTPSAAFEYGLFIGQRYRHGHVVWVLGGDNTPETPERVAVWHQLARGITVGVAGDEDYSRTLMTYHINANRSSSRVFHDAPWLDFNMVQVWGNEPQIYPMIARDYRLEPVRPTGLGEGSYEDGPQYPTRPVDALKIRRQAYWSYLAGGYHTYGNTNIWNFGSYRPEVTDDWRRALESQGAQQLSVLAHVFRGLEWWRLTPDATVFAGGSGQSDGNRHAAAVSSAGDLLVVYFSSPATASLRLNRLSRSSVAVPTWVDPQTGARKRLPEIEAGGVHTFTTPDHWSDALLLVESVDVSLPSASASPAHPARNAGPVCARQAEPLRGRHDLPRRCRSPGARGAPPEEAAKAPDRPGALVAATTQHARDQAPAAPRDEAALCSRFRDALAVLHEKRSSVGDYVEFGVFNGSSLCCMYKVLTAAGNGHSRLIGFDSFEGLPPTAATDSGGHWRPGAFSCSLDFTRRVLQYEGVDTSRVELVKGFSTAPSPPRPRTRLRIEKASVVMADCDLYQSTVEALRFCAPAVVDHAVMLFDDWFPLAERGLGERKALEEWLDAEPASAHASCSTFHHTAGAFSCRACPRDA